ncbi:MAG: 30S ribosomal protein S20 [Candidatus Omnitrophica bacterium]|nr:30S ribosomal protein S20 [Candidatus Omnitrophota bacterium]
MPQRRAAKKDLRKNAKRHQGNLVLKANITSAIKKFKKTLENKEADNKADALRDVYKILDKATSKKLIHPKKASRKKSRLAKLFNATLSKS